MSRSATTSSWSRARRTTNVRPLLIAFLAIAVMIVVATTLSIRSYARRGERAAGATMLATAQLQSALIARDLAERGQDARLLSLRSEVWRSADPASGAEVRRQSRPGLWLAMRQTRETFGYKQVELVDASMHQLYPGTEQVEPDERRLLRQVIARGRLAWIPLRIDSMGGLEYGVIHPVFAGADSSRLVVGAVLLVSDATSKLLPLLAHAGGAYQGAESVLGQREGDSLAIVAATGAGRRLAPLSRRIALSDTRSAAPRLYLGRGDDVVRGLDYRGIAVLEAGHRVTGAPWIVIAQVRRATLNDAQRAATTFAIATAAILLMLSALVLRIIWLMADRRATSRHYALASRYLAATTSSIDGYAMMSRTGQLLDVNAALERMTGYSRAELLRLTLADLKLGMERADVPDWLAHLAQAGSARFQSQWRRRDGSTLDVDISTSYLGEDQEGQLFSFVRDISEQIETNAQLQRLNTLYYFLNRASESLFAARSTQAAFEAVCRIAVEDGRFQLAWVGVVEPAAGVVRPVAWQGSASEYVKPLHITIDPALPTSQGPTGRCINQARTVIVNDFAHDAQTAPWHGLAAEHGLGASAALPVIVEGTAVAALMFYAAAPGYFTDELVGLLGEITRLLALVVQSDAVEERRRAEEERRRHSEERFRRLFESSPIAMFVQDVTSQRITRVNRAFTELLGYTLDDLPSAEVQMEAFYPDPEYRARLQRIFAHDVTLVTAEGPPVRSPDLRIRCKDGTERAIQGFVSRAGTELILGWVDLTELRANQAMLQEAEAIARLGSWSHDLRTDTIRTSPDFLRVLGIDKRLLERPAEAGLPWLLKLFHEDERRRALEAFRSHREVDEVIRAATIDGRRQYLRVRIRLERDAAGAPRRAVGSLQDVTAEVLASRELVRYRDHLQELVDERTAELARANATLQMTDQRLKAMLEMSQRAASLDEADILQLGVDEATKLTASGVGFLHVLTDDESRVALDTWATGTPERCNAGILTHVPVMEAGLLADAIRHRAPLLQNDPQLGAGRLRLPPGHMPLSRHLVVPVIEGDRVRMLLGVGNKESAYDASDVQELQLVGHDVWSVVQRRRADVALERAYERVRASDERFAVAMEASSEGVWEWDVPRGTISFNDSYATMLGYAPAEMAKTLTEWRHLLHPDERDRVGEQLLRALAEDSPYAAEFRMRAKDGTYRWVLARGRVVERDAAGRAIRAVGTHTDLTARRQAEDELRSAKEQADAASGAKSAFLAVMSHEIRTPLSGVIAMAEILAQSPLPAGDMDAVRTIQTSAHALLAVIDDILDFSKVEAGRMELDLTDVSLLQVTESLAESLLPVAKAREVDLKLFVAPDVPRLVRCDAVRVRQILYNLTGNAIKFSAGRADARGIVRLRVEVAQDAPLRIVMRIVDNGIGMSEETMARVFTSFSQGEVATTRKFGGTGLGLAITKRLVELMHGTIEVESTPDAGSTFTVTLPLAVADARPSLVPHDLHGVSCVLVCAGFSATDDVRRLLEFAGASVCIVTDAIAAAAEARRTEGMCVVLQQLAAPRATLDPAFDDLPLLRHLVLTVGRRTEPRLQLPNVVTLDCDLLRPRRLIRAVAVAAGRASPEAFDLAEEGPSVIEPIAPPTIAEARNRGRLILVAEDDRTNQKVILRQLGMLGHAAEVADDGLQALRMWREGRYALLLSDLHMPEMDGYALTRSIRAEEGRGARLPIVALTANALRGEAARAAAAGMDGYLTKPLSLDALRALVDRFITPEVASASPPGDDASASAAAGPPIVAPTGPPAAMVDVSVLEGLVGGDQGVVLEFLSDYQQSAAATAPALRQALDEGDLRQVVATAHRLKSSSRAIGALRLGDLCAEIENAAKMQDLAALAMHGRSFDGMVARVDGELTALLHHPWATPSRGGPDP